jgi:hypothetical protein
VLCCVGGGIGNVVMATPALAALARLGFEVSVYLQPEAEPAAELLRGWDALRDVIVGPPPAPERFDFALHTVWSRRRGIHPDERSPGRVDLRNMHEAEANMVPVRALGYAGPLPPAYVETAPPRQHLLPPRTPRAPRTATAEGGGTATTAGAKRPAVLGVLGGECRCWVLAPGCNPDPFWERKRWGGWRELAERMGGIVVYLGTARDSRPWMSARGAVDLTGRTTLAEAAALIAGARAVVAIDNGLAHIAAALGVPTVVLFGATSETKNRPLGPRVRLMTRPLPCRPCQMTPRWDACSEWRCMGFAVDEVARALRSLGEGGRRRSRGWRLCE